MSVDQIQYTPIVIPMDVSVSDETIDMETSMLIEAVTDYERLDNKPSINGVELIGNKTSDDLGLANKIRYDTVEGWAHDLDYIPAEGEIIIYTNYTVQDGVNIPAIKVGDGLAYAADLPFVDDGVRDALLEHISNLEIHITAEERAFWNNKVRCFMDDDDTVVFTTH